MISIRLPAAVAAALAVSVLLAACGGAASTPSPSPGIIDSAAAAARAVVAKMPLFEGIKAKDPDLIGQAYWYEATPSEAAKPPVTWRVVFRVGWGDCPSGCIDEHTWTYDVAADGGVTLVVEAGPALPQAVVDELRGSSGFAGVTGRVTAGPTCPVEQPNDPACAPRLVAGAVLVVTGAGGAEVARVTADAGGQFAIGLQPGDYTLVPQPVEGLMGTAAPMPFTVVAGSPTVLDVSYDTGIR